MQLDSYTILIACCGLLVIFGAAYVVLWAYDRRSHWLLWWGLPLVFNGVALTLYARAGWQTDFVSIAFGNGARIFALGCMWYAVRLFAGRRPPWGAISALSLLWVALCLYPPFLGSMEARIVGVSVLNAVICALTARELWIDRGDGLHSRLPLAGAFAAYGVLMLVRIAMVPFAPFPFGAGPLDPTWLAVYSWLVVGLAIFATVFFLAMTMERREAEQRSFALSDPLTGLLNRRVIEKRFAQFYAAGFRAMAVIDLDKFKSVNDTHGHVVGDAVLHAAAEALEPDADTLALRMGGEEFLLLLRGRDAASRAERRRQAIPVRVAARVPGLDRVVTASMGLVEQPPESALRGDFKALYAHCDRLLYEAKHAGRNRTMREKMRGFGGAAGRKARAA